MQIVWLLAVHCKYAMLCFAGVHHTKQVRQLHHATYLFNLAYPQAQSCIDPAEQFTSPYKVGFLACHSAYANRSRHLQWVPMKQMEPVGTPVGSYGRRCWVVSK